MTARRMRIPERPMLQQFHGNDMDALRRHACARLSEKRPPPLAIEWLLVPNAGMGKWLRREVAATQGIAAQIACDSPAVFLRKLAALVLEPAPGPQSSAWDKDQLELRLLGLLPELQHAPGFEPVAQYLSEARDPCRTYRLARRLAELYDRYLLWRPEWLLAWEAGRSSHGAVEEAHPWQPALWRALHQAIAADCPAALHHAALVTRLVEALREGREQKPLPHRLTGFGVGAFTPGLLQVLHALGARIDVALYVFNPCAAYWNDLVSPREHARQRVHDPARAALSDVGHPLLASWGGLGREQLELLYTDETADLHWVGEAREDGTLLQVLQNDILMLRDPAAPFVPAPDDHSIVFAEAHSRVREVEVLHDALLHLFQNRRNLEPRDIVVMAPAIEEYAAAIEAVFGEVNDNRHIPWSIADRAPFAGNAVMRAFLHLLALPESRFGANELLGLISVPAIARRFDIDPEELEGLRERVLASGVRLGLDESGRTGAAPALARNTWRFGLQRLLLGVALEDTVPFAGILPIASPGGDDAERIGELADFIERLAEHAVSLREARVGEDWREALDGLLSAFFPEASADVPEVAVLQRAIAESCDALADARVEAPIPREVIVELLTSRLARADGGQGFLGGGVNFCQLTPLRSIPFRVVCLLGMNAGEFPRQHESSAFDLMARDRHPGDPSRRDDDRYLFLESLVAARECLYLSRVARDPRKDEAQEPALPLAELRDCIDRRCGEGTSERLTRQHPLMPFDPRAFDARNPQQSFRHEWLPARHALGTTRESGFVRETLPSRPLGKPRIQELLAFWRNPVRSLLRERWGIWLEEGDRLPEDSEPLALDALELHRLKDELLRGMLGGGEERAIQRVHASGILPLGTAGEAVLQKARDQTLPLAERLRHDLGTHVAVSVELPPELPVAGVLDGIRGGRLLAWTVSGEAKGRHLLDLWIRHLAGCAAGVLEAPSRLHDMKRTHTIAPIPAASAFASLAELVALREEGFCRALPFFPDSAWALVNAKDPGSAIQAAINVFLHDERSRGESRDPSIARVFGTTDEVLDDAFRVLALRVFEPLHACLQGGEA